MRGLPCANCGRKVGADYRKVAGKIYCVRCFPAVDVITKDRAPADAHAVRPEPPQKVSKLVAE